MRIELEAVLGDSPLADCGMPTGAFWSTDRSLVAVASSFRGWWWHGRNLGDAPTRERVCVYEVASRRLLNVVDGIRWPIRDIAFHSSRPLIAIGCGAYDGGYSYDGTVVLVDLISGGSSSLFQDSDNPRWAGPEVCRVSFSEDGATLHLITSVRTEEDDKPDGTRAFLAMDIPADRWPAIGQDSNIGLKLPARAAPGLTEDAAYPAAAKEAVDVALALLEPAEHLRRRSFVWDLHWANEETILCCGDAALFEQWHTDGECSERLPPAGEERGVQVVPLTDGSALINVGGSERWEPERGWTSTARVERFAGGASTSPVELIDFPAILSIAANGSVLARDTCYYDPKDVRNSRDLLVAPDAAQTQHIDLERYSPRHYLRIDAAPSHYALSGGLMRLMEVNAVTGAVRRISRIETILPPGFISSGGGCYVDDSRGEALILATVSGTDRASRVTRRSARSGRREWSRGVGRQVSAVCWFEDAGIVATGTTQGEVSLLNATTGSLLAEHTIRWNEAPDGVVSLAASRSRLAVGTHTGRIAIFCAVT